MDWEGEEEDQAEVAACWMRELLSSQCVGKVPIFT